MINTGIIGKGKWGSILYNKLLHLSKIRFVCNSKDNYQLNLKKAEWVFVSTPDNTHYKIVSNCLKAKKKVFCEKPLTANYDSSKKLFQLAKKFNTKLYVSDVENFKNKKITLNKGLNVVIRKKKGKGTHKELLYKLLYHDLYLLFNQLKRHKIVKIEKINNNKYLSFMIKYKKFSIKFIYDVKTKDTYHRINNIDFLTFKKDPLYMMLKKVLKNKVDFKKNNEASLFSNLMIDKIKSKII
jgi:hypothetical protein